MVRAPIARARSDHGERADRRRRIDRRIRRNRRKWMHARGRWLIRRQHLRGAREGQIRRFAANDGARRHLIGRRCRLAVHDHGAGPGRRQLGGVFGIGEKREIARTGLLDLRHAANLNSGIALDRAFQTTGQLAERHEVENITAQLLPGLRPGGTALPSARRNGPSVAGGGGARRREITRWRAVRIERKRAAQLGERRAGRDRPGDLMQSADRAAPREKVPDHGKRKEIAEHVRTRERTRPAPRRSAPGECRMSRLRW